MPGNVFISCGQATNDERRIANEVAASLQQLGFTSYVAIAAQSIQDVNSGIIGRLRLADYYVFIDFRREQLVRDGQPKGYRGSLFTHQELAIAYLLGFDRAVFFREEEVNLEGVGQYMLSNATTFTNANGLPQLVIDAVRLRGWSSNYSRHLIASDVTWTQGPTVYESFGNTRYDFVFYASIRNQRSDVAAMNAIGRLIRITDQAGEDLAVHDRSRLQWGGQSGFECTIFPSDSESLSLFAIDRDENRHVYLHSARDIPPQHPILALPGTYRLRYQLVAGGFPLFEFDIDLCHTGNISTTSAEILET